MYRVYILSYPARRVTINWVLVQSLDSRHAAYSTIPVLWFNRSTMIIVHVAKGYKKLIASYLYSELRKVHDSVCIKGVIDVLVVNHKQHCCDVTFL